MTPEAYQLEVLARLDLGLWAVIGFAAFAVFALGVLLVRAVW